MFFVAVALFLSIAVPVGAFYFGERNAKRFKSALGLNIFSFFVVMVLGTLFAFSGSGTAFAEPAVSESAFGSSAGLAYIAAGLVTGMSTIGAGIAVASAASAALGALSENEGIMGKALIFVALAEGVALYGLLISFIILGKV